MTDTPGQSDLSHLLTRAELDAERLVSLLRMSVSIGLVIFLWIAVSPPEATTTGVLHVLKFQWIYAAGTVGCYFLLGLLTWILSRRGLVRVWMIWLTATADVVFIVISVWLSMQNTQLTGDAVFTLPSIWLVPIVLSFSVLRVNPKVMAYTVVLLVIGVGFLISVEAGQMRGLFDGPVWIFLSPPPNLMRLVMIGLAGVVLYVAVRRTQQLLHRSIDTALRNANLTRYLPEQLVPRLAGGGLDQLQQGQRHDVGVLFIDMRDFTGWSENRAPQEVTGLMTEYRDRIASVSDKNGGIIDKFMGDAAMIVFERDNDPQSAARACVACAISLAQSMADWTEGRKASGETPVNVGIGAHWGEVFSGVVGSQQRLEYSVFGDTVNAAARLEQMTKAEGMEIVLSGDLLSAAGLADDGWDNLGDVALRGRSHELRLFGRRTGSG